MESILFRQIVAQFAVIIKHRKLQILVTILLALGPVIYYNETAPQIYEAGVSIIFEDISNPLRTDNYSQLRTYQRETYILNRIQEIESRAVAKEIAASLPADVISRIPLPGQIPPYFDKQTFHVDYIRESMATAVVRRTDVVRIVFSTEDPVLSLALANTSAEVLRTRNRKLKKMEVSGLLEFIEAQLNVFQNRLDVAEQKLTEFKKYNKITSLQRESEEILSRVTDAEVRYNQIRTQKRSTEERLQTVLEKLSLNRQRLVPSATDVSSPAYSKLKQTLVDLQFQYTNLLVQDYDERHPKLVELKQDIEQTKENLTQEALKLLKDDNVLDPLSQINAYLTQSISLEVNLETYKAQERALKQILKGYENRLKSLPQKELELASLMRSKNVNEKLYLMMAQKREEARISEAERIGNIRVIDWANLPMLPVRPRKKFNLAVGSLLALLLAFGIAFLREFLNKTVKTSEDLERLTSWQVLAVVPKIEISNNGVVEALDNSKKNGHSETDSKRSMLSNNEPRGVAAEAFRVLRTNMQFLNHNEQLKTVLVTSVSAGDGKSTTATNLGITLTKLGLKVLIIDADLRRPTVHKLLRVGKEPGLGDVLMNHHTIVNDLIAEDLEKEFYDRNTESPVWSSIQNLKGHNKDVEMLEENFREFSMSALPDGNHSGESKLQYRNLLNTSLIESIQTTRVKGLKVLTSGRSVENPSEILSTVSLKLLLEEVGNKFDFVLIDSPPLLLVPDSMIVSTLVDGVLIVIESNKSDPHMLLNAQKFLSKTGANVVGAVLNKVDVGLLYRDEEYYYYG